MIKKLNTAHFSFLKSLYLNMFPMKLKTKNTIINSNHQALYIQIFAASVEYQVSKKVPIPIAVGNAIKSTLIKRLEAK